jgi:hypothetical protein
VSTRLPVLRADNVTGATLDHPPPAPLSPDTFAARLYLALAPLARGDEQQQWSLLILVNAIGVMYQLLEDYLRDTPSGPGWSPLLDLDRCPPEALPWLGQFVGVRVIQNTTPDEQRQRIRSTDGFRRGGVEAIRAAAAATLTGAQTVVILERDTDPYNLSVTTYADETPDPVTTYTALLAAKPAGLTLGYTAGETGQTYDILNARVASFDEAETRYVNYIAVQLDPAPPPPRRRRRAKAG